MCLCARVLRADLSSRKDSPAVASVSTAVSHPAAPARAEPELLPLRRRAGPCPRRARAGDHAARARSFSSQRAAPDASNAASGRSRSRASSSLSTDSQARIGREEPRRARAEPELLRRAGGLSQRLRACADAHAERARSSRLSGGACPPRREQQLARYSRGSGEPCALKPSATVSATKRRAQRHGGEKRNAILNSRTTGYIWRGGQRTVSLPPGECERRANASRARRRSERNASSPAEDPRSG